MGRGCYNSFFIFPYIQLLPIPKTPLFRPLYADSLVAENMIIDKSPQFVPQKLSGLIHIYGSGEIHQHDAADPERKQNRVLVYNHKATADEIVDAVESVAYLSPQ